MKALRFLGLPLLALVAFLVLGTMTAAAQGPVSFAAPINAPYIDTQSHTISTNQFVLYRFDYVLDDPGARPLPVTTITLPNGFNTGLNFEVWTPDAVTDTANNHFIGRGSPKMVHCDTSETGACPTGDMIWVGAFGSSGPYYVRVVANNVFNPNVNMAAIANAANSANSTTSSTNTTNITTTTTTTNTTTASNTSGIEYKLIITGDAVRLGGSPIAVTGPNTSGQQSNTGTNTNTGTQQSTSTTGTNPSTGSQQPPTGTTTTANAQPSMIAADDPIKAVALDNSTKSIPAKSVQWYKFDYKLGDDGTRPIIMITLPNVFNQSDVKFEVYAPEVLTNWFDNHPTGTSTFKMVKCDTSESGLCSTNQLTWVGSFGAPGTYYVRVINNTSNPLNATLTRQEQKNQ